MTYVPQSVFIPPGITAERELPAVLAEEDRMRCDRRTLFYDLIRSPERRELVCMGPPFWNLGGPVAISAQGAPAEFTVEEVDTPLVRRRAMEPDRRLSITRVRLDENHMGRTIELRFSFREFEVEASCSSAPQATAREKVDLTLTTLQKDNDVQWIKDWCIWHHRVHGVGRIVIYDNDSDNIDAVYESLSSLTIPELVLVRWSFPYGPYSRQSRGLPRSVHFAQMGSLNHCRMVFGSCTHWCMNLDIDEYLYSNGDAPLPVHLRGRKYRNRSVVYLRSYGVPMTTDFKSRRCFDSPFRWRAPSRGGIKYIHRPERTEVSGIHRLTTLSRWRALRAAKHCAAKAIMFTGLWRLGRGLLRRAKRAAQGLGLDGAGPSWRLWRREDLLFFFHFEALNTGWYRERRAGRPDPRSVVADDRILEMKDVLEK